MQKTFVGFGFGPIQNALFVYEASLLGNFERFVMVDVDRDLIRALRGNDGAYTINIARADRIDQATVQGVEIYNSREAADRERIIQAIEASDEMCTALPSVDFYTRGDESSVVSLLAEGINRRKQSPATIIYTAENNNRAAEVLEECLTPRLTPEGRRNLQILNTVIGKMSGVITETETIRDLNLARITPDTPRAVLVEAFNRILISKITLPGFRRGIDVFLEKTDLLPFEEAKLYGHNAIHALIAYLSDLKGYRVMAEAGGDREIMDVARRAFIEESGPALIRKNAGFDDPLFTTEGYRDYADDLLGRMVNPNLNDLVVRVGRDHPRKLGIEDRLYGTMCLTLEHDVQPLFLARGAAAGILSLIARDGAEDIPLPQGEIDEPDLRSLLLALWGENEKVNLYGDRLIGLTWQALQELQKLDQLRSI